MKSNVRKQQQDPLEELQSLGLSAAESRAYLALVTEGSLRAAEVAALADLPRSSAYPVLRSLVEQGLVEGGAGYRARFRALPPGDARSSLSGSAAWPQ
jgi:sugar-specific transcriptional regulator TrmB